MANISAYDSSSIGVLFSSLNSTASKNASLFGTTTASVGMFGVNLSDYALIKSGSYHKLLSAYYSDDEKVSGSAKKALSSSTSTSTSKDDTKTLASIEDSAKNMQDTADKLLTTGTKSVFEKVTTTDEDGNSTTDYDKDAIYKAVKSFVNDYNSLIDDAADSKSTNIQRAVRTMANYSKVNENLLGKAGITVGSDNKLLIDEEDFKNADMQRVKSLFQDKGGYGYQVSKQASLLESYAKSEASKANTYSGSGTYTYNYNTGALYNSEV